MLYQFRRVLLCGFCCLLLLGCQSPPDPAASLSPVDLATRQMQTRVFVADDEVKVLKACAALLQDYGYHIEISESRLGLLVGSKERGGINVPRQVFRASVVTRPSSKRGSVEVRLAFQRVVLTQHLQVVYREAIHDPRFFREFFYRLSKSFLLMAQQ